MNFKSFGHNRPSFRPECPLKAFLDLSAIASFLNSIVSSTQFELICLSQKHNIHIPAVYNQAQYQKWRNN